MANNTEKRTVEIVMDGRQPSNTLKGLNADIRTLNKSIRDLPAGSKEFEVQAKKLRELQQQYQALQQRVNYAGQSLQYFRNQLKAFSVGTIVGNVATSIGASIQQQISGSITYMADLSDELANIRKTSGQTAEQVDAFNRSLDKIDTRTTKKSLREIAIGLGQIGEIDTTTSLDQMIEKVQAIDKVVVSLGDEFGGSAQEITTQISILRNNLTDFKTGNYTEDILHIANALNVLGASGLATAPYVVDSANRMSGVLESFGATTPQILGSAAAMQELGIDVERGATAFTKLIPKMLQNKEAFAKVAGAKTNAEIKEFTRLLNTDVVSALIKVAKGAKESGTQNTIFANILNDLGTEGSVIMEVLSKIGQNTELFEQKIASTTETIKENNSINQEFALLNDNNAAKIEKLKKSFIDLVESNTFNTFLTKAINLSISFIRWIKDTGDWIGKNIFIFKSIGLAILTYVASLRLATIWQARKIALDKIENAGVSIVVAAIKGAILVQELWTKQITFAEFRQRMLNKTTLANPYVLLASVLIGATTAMYGWINAQKEAAKQKISDSFDKEIKKINKSSEKAIQDLEKLFPDPSKLTKEQIEKNAKELQKKIQEQRSILAKEAAENKRLLEESQKTDVVKVVSANNPNASTDNVTFQQKKTDIQKLFDKKAFELQNARVKKESDYYKKLQEINQNYIDKKKEISQYESDQDEAAKKKLLEKQQKFNDELKKLLNDVERAKIEAIEEENARELLFLQKDKEDKDAAINQEIDTQIALAKELKKGTAVIAQLQRDRAFLLLGNEEKYQRDRKALIDKQAKEKNDDAYKKEIDAVTQKFEAEKLVEKQLYAEGKSNKEKYDHQIQDLDRQSKVELLAITKKYGKDTNDLQQAIADIDIKIAEDRAERIKRALLNEAEVRVRLANIDVNNNKVNRFGALKEKYDAETNALVTKLATEAGLTELNEETIFNIKKQFADQFAELDQEYSQERQSNIQSIVDSSITAFQGIFDAIISGRQQQIQAELDMLQQQTDAELKMLDDKKNKRLVYEDEYAMKKDAINNKMAAKERELKRKQAVMDKAAAIFSIGINTAQAIMSALAGPWPASIAFAALAGVMGAVQLAFAISKPIPYGKGGPFLGDVLNGPSHSDGGMPVLNPDTGQVVAELEGGEPILSKKTYANNKQVVDALLYSSRYNDGKKVKVPSYFSSTPTYAYGGVIKAYQTTSLARAGILPGATSTTIVNNNSNSVDDMKQTVTDLSNVVNKLSQKLEEPFYSIFDFDYYNRSLENIANAKKIGNVG